MDEKKSYDEVRHEIVFNALMAIADHDTMAAGQAHKIGRKAIDGVTDGGIGSTNADVGSVINDAILFAHDMAMVLATASVVAETNNAPYTARTLMDAAKTARAIVMKARKFELMPAHIK